MSATITYNELNQICFYAHLWQKKATVLFIKCLFFTIGLLYVCLLQLSFLSNEVWSILLSLKSTHGSTLHARLLTEHERHMWVRLTSDWRGGKQHQLQGIRVANHTAPESENLLYIRNYYTTALRAVCALCVTKNIKFSYLFPYLKCRIAAEYILKHTQIIEGINPACRQSFNIFQ